MKRARALPASLPPRLLSLEQAAEYCGGISTAQFTAAIGKEVPPIELGKHRTKFWDVRALDYYLDIQSGLIEAPLRPADDFIRQLGAEKARTRR